MTRAAWYGIGTIDGFRIITTPMESNMILTFHPETGLQQHDTKPMNCELGTMIRHRYSKQWQMRVKRRTGGKTWRPVKAVPKMVQLQALLLDIPL